MCTVYTVIKREIRSNNYAKLFKNCHACKYWFVRTRILANFCSFLFFLSYVRTMYEQGFPIKSENYEARQQSKTGSLADDRIVQNF